MQPEIATRPFMYKEGQVLLRPLGSPEADPTRPGDARVDYDTPHVKPWGFDMALYLLTKGIATGALLVSLLLPFAVADPLPLTTIVGPAISLLFLVITAVLLIADLERPERFHYILLRPNWRSWMVWGAYFLTAQGLITTVWIVAAWFGADLVLDYLRWPAVVCAILTTGYTGFLFAQGLARDLWQGPQATVDLFAQAVVEGAAVLLLASLFKGIGDPRLTRALGMILSASMVAHVALIVFENLLARGGTRHRQLAIHAIRRGAFAKLFWGGAISVAAASVVLAALFSQLGSLGAAAVLALAGSFAWEYIWVEAGQSVPLS